MVVTKDNVPCECKSDVTGRVVEKKLAPEVFMFLRGR